MTTIKKPSISELLQLLDKPALLKWANKQGLAGIDITSKRKEWLNTGTSIHNQVENFVRNGDPFLNPDTEAAFKLWSSDKKIICFEKDVECEYFKGRLDMIVEWKGNKYLVDFKKDAKRIYFENKLQLVAYSMCEDVYSFAIVSHPGFTMMNFSPLDRQPYIDIIKALSTVYRCKKMLEEIV